MSFGINTNYVNVINSLYLAVIKFQHDTHDTCTKLETKTHQTPKLKQEKG